MLVHFCVILVCFPDALDGLFDAHPNALGHVFPNDYHDACLDALLES